MLRPRWHDVLIVSAILGVLVVGVWALWWDDVRGILHLGPGEGSSVEQVPVTNTQT
jgi:hypothetical protein